LVVNVSSLDVTDATLLVGIPAAVLLVVGLLVRDARSLGRRSGRRRGERALDVILLLLATALALILIARFFLLT
jgi:hypothetical protein